MFLWRYFPSEPLNRKLAQFRRSGRLQTLPECNFVTVRSIGRLRSEVNRDDFHTDEAFDGQIELRTSFETFAIGAMFDQVLEAANPRLDVRAHDIETGRGREIITLSGGETFIAALTLALSLSDIMAIPSGAIRLDAIFIDEGFGSLDTENDAGTLGQVPQVLQSIAGERNGRLRIGAGGAVPFWSSGETGRASPCLPG